MGTEQGKTSNVNALAHHGRLAGRRHPERTTTFRPPFTPVAMGALAGRIRRAFPADAALASP